jgi:hypothetical protein
MKLGSWLIARGKITGVQLKRALLDQSFYGGHLSTSLIKLGYLDERTLGEYLADSFQVPYASADRFQNVPAEILRMIPRALAEKHQILPLGLEGKKLQLAMMNPRDLLVIDEVAFLTGFPVEAWVSSENLLLDALERWYEIPRPVRETIPLADRVDQSVGIPANPTGPPPPPARAEPAQVPRPGPEEVGLDGRPLSAASDLPEYYPTPSAAPGGPVPIPRNLVEWREQAESDPVPAAPSQPPTPAPREAQMGGPLPPMPLPPGSPPPAARAGGSRRSSLALVPPPPPTTLDEVAQRLRDSGDRDEIFETLLGFCAGRFLRTALFVVMQDQVIGWSGKGEGIEPARIRATRVPFSAPSIFSYFRVGSDFYFGPVPDLPANQAFYRDLGVPSPDRVLLVPLAIKGRLIAVLYGDNGTTRREEPDIALFRRLAQKAVLALEILILRNKIAMI